jgi:hypothetical protein
MRTLVIGLASAVLLLVGAAWVHAQATPNRPPGIAAASWIAITDSVGIVITSTTAADRPAFQRFDGRTLGSLRANGRLMALHHGVWLEFDELGNTAPRVQPAH